ncbi:MAG: 2-amino-4-hydroxy-6-hydroxymethyldihydropteridine diphosphokinase [Proteobacteria bacterium]|nr:2-amino-4-hydroxy-6-hydroxymethyldihydropteridine diphosphokinase [Pseudomonadota bacterium]
MSAYIGLGSNLDDPIRQIDDAFKLLDSLPESNVVSRSSLYRSAPYGPVEQPDFINAVAGLQTMLPAGFLLELLQGIECTQGRAREHGRWGPRVIDLDLLVFGNQEITETELTVPHPGIAERNFVLLPLREIAPNLLIPGLGSLSDIVVDVDEPRIERIS